LQGFTKIGFVTRVLTAEQGLDASKWPFRLIAGTLSKVLIFKGLELFEKKMKKI